jgi:hypothetical protein
MVLYESNAEEITPSTVLMFHLNASERAEMQRIVSEYDASKAELEEQSCDQFEGLRFMRLDPAYTAEQYQKDLYKTQAMIATLRAVNMMVFRYKRNNVFYDAVYSFTEVYVV